MVNQICVKKGNHFSGYEQPIVTLQNYADDNLPEVPGEFVEYFDSLTGNFEDLGYWNNQNFLHGKNSGQVALNLHRAIKRMRSDGYHPYAKQPDPSLYTWEFGHEPYVSGGSCIPVELPKKDRIEILLIHLKDLLKVAQRYDHTYYFFQT